MEPPILKLIILRGPRSGETLEFRPGSKVRIGRVARGNDVAIKDPGVSSKHLTIDSDSGKWLVQDLDSSNGTGINSKPIPPFTPFELRDNDTIELGECSSMLVRVQEEMRPGKEVEEVAPEGRRRRGRPKKAGGAAEKERENVGPVAEVEESNVRVTRNRKKLGLGTAEIGVGKRTRRNVRGLPLPRPAKEVEKEIEEEEEREEKSGRRIGEEVVEKEGEEGREEEGQRKFGEEVVEEEEEAEKREKVESGGKTSEFFVVVKEERVEFEVEEEGKVEEGTVVLDWEKATLGEWFDHMEEHLRKQVVEASEAMIDEMRMKTERVCEYLTRKGQVAR